MRISTLSQTVRGGPPRRGSGRHRRGLMSGLVAAATATTMAVAGGTAQAGTGAPATTVAPGVSSAATTPVVKTLTLPTGDKVTAGTGGGQTTYGMDGASAGSGQFFAYQGANGDHYIVPTEAQPFLDRQLSPSLFDVTALLQAGLTTGSKIPVTLAFAAGDAPAAPAGVTLTSVSGQSAQGYLTAASGPAFAAALRAAIGADVRAGRQPGSTAPFGGLTSLSVAGSTVAPLSSPAVSPLYKMSVLQINALDATGAPTDTGQIVLADTDSIAKQDTQVFTGGGVAQIAVPAGHYALAGFFPTFDDNGLTTAVRFVALDDFTVPASGTAMTSVTLDARDAVNQVSVSTPQPATQDYLITDWRRQDTKGQTTADGIYLFGNGVPMLTNSQPVAKTGKVDLLVQWGGAGTGTGTPYRYDLAFGPDKVPADEAYVAKPSQIATVNDEFYQDPAYPGDGGLLTGAADSFSPVATEITGNPPPTGPFIQYLGAADGGVWAQLYATASSTFFTADNQTYAAGHTYSVQWAHGPLAPNVGTHDGPQGFLPCEACASGADVSVLLNEISDSVPNHSGVSFENFNYAAYLNGAPVFNSTVLTNVTLTGLPSTPNVIRQVLDTDASNTGVDQSVTTHTDLSFVYTPGKTPGGTLPSEVICEPNGIFTSPCQILPALNLSYNLATDLNNTSRPGVQTLGLTVDHLSYDGIGSHARITSATVSVSFDGGVTWQPATLAGTDGAYTASWLNPASAAGTSPSIKVTATDAIGGSISQTVNEAYTIAGGTPSAGSGSQASGATAASTTTPVSPDVVDACGPAPAGSARCLAEVRTDTHAGKGVRGPAAAALGGKVTALPPGYSPAQLQSAYKLPSAGGGNQTVALVDAGDDPNAEADLAVYRSTYGLPACTTANGCFRKVDQAGTAGPLPADQYWDVEISLDLDMVSASCPNCEILLVEANDPQLADLGASVNTAVSLGATEVSNSYGGAEVNGVQAYAADYSHPGAAIVASSGDDGFGIPSFPATLSTVIAAGGTTLTPASNARGWTETAWAGSGSGCSGWTAKPSWQKDKHCPTRTVADVAADADPNTGPAVYDTDNGNAGWLVVGGTSASSPFIAGVVALAGNPGAFPNASYLYAHTGKLFDVVGGGNAGLESCGRDYLCNAVKGYDGPTGNGSPDGIAAF